MFAIPACLPLAWCGLGFLLLSWGEVPAAMVTHLAASSLAWFALASRRAPAPAPAPARAAGEPWRRSAWGSRPAGPVRSRRIDGVGGPDPAPMGRRLRIAAGLLRRHGLAIRPIVELR